MARYLETAAKANEVITDILDVVDRLDPQEKSYITSQLLYLYNLGIRTAPRATQSTVRLNAVRAAAKGTEAKVSMTTKEGYNGKTYNALSIQCESTVNVEGD